MTRETCCGSFPDFICGDCPHATPEQAAQGGMSYKFVGTGARCMGCFESKDIHLGPELKCPPAPQKALPPLPEVKAPAPAPVAPAKPRKQECSSCHKPWNGQRLPRPSPEGVFCGTCNQQMYYE